MSEECLGPKHAAVLQFDVITGDHKTNLTTVESLISKLKPEPEGLIVLPELWASGFAYNSLEEEADNTNAILAAVQTLAGRYGIVIAGSLLERNREKETESYYNTLFISGATGVIGRYRKQQLFLPMDEDHFFSSGENPSPTTTPLGTLAALVCYDLRFPELASSQCSQGARLIIVAAQWPTARTEHWRTLLKARAIENQAFVVACNRCGTTGNTTFAGHSAIIAPDGKVLLEMNQDEGAAGVELDYKQLDQIRKKFNTVGKSPYRFPDRLKIHALSRILPSIQAVKSTGAKVVFTNGCFDILHQGHVTYLEEARKQGDCLVVGLNSDSSIRSIKGPDRPVNHENSRARVLAALGCVDYVVIFSEDTPLKLISAILPDILVKGADWPLEKIIGAREVLANKGKVINIPMVADFSTTALIDKIKEE